MEYALTVNGKDMNKLNTMLYPEWCDVNIDILSIGLPILTHCQYRLLEVISGQVAMTFSLVPDPI